MTVVKMFISRFSLKLIKCTYLPLLGGCRWSSVDFKTSSYAKVSLLKSNEKLDQLIKKHAPKIIYNSIIEGKLIKCRRKKLNTRIKNEEPLPISLKYLYEGIPVKNEISEETEQEAKQLIHFPFREGLTVEESATNLEDNMEQSPPDMASAANEEVRQRHSLQRKINNWMMSYDNYDDSVVFDYDEDAVVEDWKINYGTPDPHSQISNVPCGGCGALLHCKDTAIPGYIPSEIYKNSKMQGGAELSAIICQRCHFLKYYNLALQVSVTTDYYPKVLQTISEKRGLVVLMVDLLDFPCSIWPGIGEIFGRHTPIFVVGNKVDLLVQDSRNFLQHIKSVLLRELKLQGFATFNIKSVALISAKTGFGIEDLITQLHSHYREKGDVYIVGSTNVGKSSLFNALLQSDYCKVQAVDLIQRATTSVWPGTTLHLLKFPIKRPVGYRQFLRHQRLQTERHRIAAENELRKEQLRVTKDPKYATLIGNIDITFNPYHKKYETSNDRFVVQTSANASGVLKMGINEKRMEFAFSKWCFDTPGVVQPEQLIHLLTTEELLITLPKELILPRSFCLKPRSSLFIGGLSRLDYVEGSGSVKLTVFASNELPITICELDEANNIYEALLGSDLFKVPTGNEARLAKWPRLEMAKNFHITGDSWYKSTSDVVLSSSGWVAITGRTDLEYKFEAWTPEKRGVYLRESLLPHAAGLTGHRMKHSVAYHKHKFFLN